jgi:protein subunit release factor B
VEQLTPRPQRATLSRMKYAVVSAEKVAELERRLEALGVREADLEEKFVRARGPGGQKVNKTSSAVFLRHEPTGIEVKVQTSRSQALNRFLARRLLAERLEAMIEERRTAEEQRVAKIRRQKRRRSRRAKEKVLAAKHHQTEKKQQRAKIEEDKS